MKNLFVLVLALAIVLTTVGLASAVVKVDDPKCNSYSGTTITCGPSQVDTSSWVAGNTYFVGTSAAIQFGSHTSRYLFGHIYRESAWRSFYCDNVLNDCWYYK